MRERKKKKSYKTAMQGPAGVSSPVCGCWMVDGGCWVSINSLPTVALSQVAEELLTLAYESGINFFDTAEVYAAGK